MICIKKFGEIIDKNSIPSGIENNNINRPVVFKYHDKKFIYYTVRGEDGIAVAEILE